MNKMMIMINKMKKNNYLIKIKMSKIELMIKLTLVDLEVNYLYLDTS